MTLTFRVRNLRVGQKSKEFLLDTKLYPVKHNTKFVKNRNSLVHNFTSLAQDSGLLIQSKNKSIKMCIWAPGLKNYTSITNCYADTHVVGVVSLPIILGCYSWMKRHYEIFMRNVIGHSF